MPATYATDLKNARLQDVADSIAGLTRAAWTGTPTQGKLLIRTADNVTLVSIDLPTVPFSVSGGVATLLGVPAGSTAIASGVAAKARIVDNAGNVVVSNLTVGTSGAHVTIASLVIEEDEFVVVTGCTIVHP